MPTPAPIELIDVRDELTVARDLIIATWLAAQAPACAGPQGSALCAVTDIARDRIEQAIAALDDFLKAETTGRPGAKAPDE